MITKEDILESITGALLSDKPTHAINIPIGWIFQAMQQYADEQSVAFAEWMDKIGNNFTAYPHCFNKIIYGALMDVDYELKHTTELLQIFKNENNGKI